MSIFTEINKGNKDLAEQMQLTLGLHPLAELCPSRLDFMRGDCRPHKEGL